MSAPTPKQTSIGELHGRVARSVRPLLGTYEALGFDTKDIMLFESPNEFGEGAFFELRRKLSDSVHVALAAGHGLAAFERNVRAFCAGVQEVAAARAREKSR